MRRRSRDEAKKRKSKSVFGRDRMEGRTIAGLLAETCRRMSRLGFRVMSVYSILLYSHSDSANESQSGEKAHVAIRAFSQPARTARYVRYVSCGELRMATPTTRWR